MANNIGREQNASWQQTMLRVKDPKKSLDFYVGLLGFQLLDKYDFPAASFSLYFIGHLSPDQQASWPEPGSEDAHKRLWTFQGTVLELTHNHGTENDAEFKYHNGNAEPRGFGHVAVLTDDVYAACDELIEKGVAFQKKPDEGRMKGLAFALDPDGYWVEIIKRTEGHSIPGRFNFAQTMIRIKDPKKSLPFYKDFFGLVQVDEKHFPEAKFSLYFLSNSWAVSEANCNGRFEPVLELTHNHGTEDDAEFKYHNGNAEPRGFGHIGFLVDDLDRHCQQLVDQGVPFRKLPQEGSMRGLAFALDPDGYSVEIIQRGMSV
eukprot:TRINITY_DN980_c0_g1_i2.p1 TRINITY_DN980_c0_g1~~TRINITY_DN980_c0_g1_i2.p1  ORF type:complete len:318 (-),score=134.32 TRINITY_DN980_c0_g1_i2:38-991(-)